MARPLRLEYEGAVYHATICVIITILRADPILARKAVAKGLLKFLSHQIKKQTYIDDVVDLIGSLVDYFKDKEPEKK